MCCDFDCRIYSKRPVFNGKCSHYARNGWKILKLSQKLRSMLFLLDFAVWGRFRARKILSVPVAGFFGPSPGAIFLVAFSFILSQSCAMTQKFRRKKKDAIFEASFCTHMSAGGLQSMLLLRCFHNDLHRYVYQSKIQYLLRKLETSRRSNIWISVSSKG